MNFLCRYGWMLLGLIILPQITDAQRLAIGGVVNQYSPVTAIDLCKNTVEVRDPAFFAPGDRVLIIQMKGADVDRSDNRNFGEVLDYRGAGNYEFHDILSINGSSITFQNAMIKLFELPGKVQLIKVAQYQTAEIQSPVTAPAWDGEIGGVVAIEADSLILVDSIDLFGKGFRGGAARNIPFCFAGGIGGYQGYRCDTGAHCGAPKGEGIYEESRILGRGPFVNGGGGGNDHNTGGGGGGNYGSGGQGGERLNVSAISCPGPGPGEGGRALIYRNDSARTFLGGGGGAGDMNNNVGTAGGNGGGILILNVDVLLSTEATINAAGESVLVTAGGDGAGGGGAGGTVMIQANQVLGDLFVNLNGGHGGDVSSGASNTFCFGPGGGGSGGVLWLSSPNRPSNLFRSLRGGSSGEQVFGNPPTNCPAGSTNGASAGDSGGVVFNLALSYPSDSFIELQSSACCDTTICLGDSALLTVTGISTFGPRYVWLDGTSDSFNFVKPNSSRVFSVSAFDHQNCLQTHILEVTVVDPQVTALADPDSGVTLGSTVQLSVDTILPGASYRWEPSSTISDSSLPNTTATPFQTTDYCLTVTDSFGCSKTDCVKVRLATPVISMPNAFSPNGDGLNDRFRIVMPEGLEVEQFVVYNRWGDLMYQSSDNNGWDGKHEGADQPAGTYVFYVHIINPADPEQIILETGSFSLIR